MQTQSTPTAASETPAATNLAEAVAETLAKLWRLPEQLRQILAGAQALDVETARRLWSLLHNGQPAALDQDAPEATTVQIDRRAQAMAKSLRDALYPALSSVVGQLAALDDPDCVPVSDFGETGALTQIWSLLADPDISKGFTDSATSRRETHPIRQLVTGDHVPLCLGRVSSLPEGHPLRSLYRPDRLWLSRSRQTSKEEGWLALGSMVRHGDRFLPAPYYRISLVGESHQPLMDLQQAALDHERHRRAQANLNELMDRERDQLAAASIQIPQHVLAMREQIKQLQAEGAELRERLVNLVPEVVQQARLAATTGDAK